MNKVDNWISKIKGKIIIKVKLLACFRSLVNEMDFHHYHSIDGINFAVNKRIFFLKMFETNLDFGMNESLFPSSYYGNSYIFILSYYKRAVKPD